MSKPLNLKCEFATNPQGIGTTEPRLSWNSAAGGTVAAYQVLVASTERGLREGAADLWDSGRIEGEPPAHVTYAGTPLASRSRAFWTVRQWDASGTAHDADDVARLEVALLNPEDWEAEWIGFPGGRNGRAFYFKTAFDLDRPVAEARAYVAGLGWHEFRINGAKMGDAVLEPAQTAFQKRVLYVTHDVTSALRVGTNVVGAIVGNGWYGAPELIVQLEITFEDGTQRRILTGRQTVGGRVWSVSDGPIVENSIYDGEIYDARLEKPQWDDSDVPDPPGGTRWWMCMIVDGPGGVLVPQTMEPIRIVETRRPVAVKEAKPGVYVFDNGQNLAGWAQLRVSGPRGTEVTLRFAESVYEDGTVNQENLRGAKARDVYILKGEGIETWEPTLTYHGFRFVQVEGLPQPPDADTIEIKVVRSDVARTAQFSSSDAMLNQIDDAVLWTEISNLHGVPTDCPQRDERMGWLNDMAARSEELITNFDVARLLSKWIDDIADAQDPRNGAISDTAPFRWGSRPADPVSVCYLLIPHLLHRHYGDAQTMARHLDGMKRWVDYLTSRAPGHIVEYSYYGDWAPPIDQGVANSIGSSAVAKNTPGELVSTGHYFYAARLLGRMARVLNRGELAETYEALAQTIYDAFNARFWDAARGVYGTGNQACNGLALYMGLVPADRRAGVVAALIADIEAKDYHLTTGNLCTKYVMEVLGDEGRLDVALKLATQTSYPSWGYMFSRGATTMWERWEEATGGGMNSHNHPMYASVGSWLHRRVAGLQVADDAVACSRFVIAPSAIEGLDFASSELETVKGRASVNWRRTGGGLDVSFDVPHGATAEVRIPKLSPGSQLTDRTTGGAELSERSDDAASFAFNVKSGSYSFTVAA